MRDSQSLSPNHKALTACIAVGALLLVLLMMFSGDGFARQEGSSVVRQDVAVIEVQYQESYAQAYRAMGRIESVQQAGVGFERSGRVASVLVDDGDTLVPGQMIATLDTARVEAQIKELTAALDLAQAQLRLAENTEKRIIDLVRKHLESPQRLDEVAENKNIAQARVTQTQASLDAVKLELEKSTITATYAASVVRRNVDPGAVVEAGQPIFELANNASLTARIPVPPKIAANLKVGEFYPLIVDEQTIFGQLISIGTQRNARTRTLDTLFAINPAKQPLLVGDLIAAKLEIELPQRGLWVPIESLAQGVRGMWTVFVVGQLGDTEVQARAVEVIYTDGNRAYITGAVKNGDWLVFNGTHRFVPQQRVFATRSNLVSQSQ